MKLNREGLLSIAQYLKDLAEELEKPLERPSGELVVKGKTYKSLKELVEAIGERRVVDVVNKFYARLEYQRKAQARAKAERLRQK